MADGTAAVVLSNRAYIEILCEVNEMAPVETGGLLLGAWRGGRCYVVESIDPGPNSKFELAYFEYDRPYTEHLINKVARLYEAKLSLVGLWHRHPGSFDQFSGVDDETNAKFASLAPEGTISGLVNVDPDFRLRFFHATLPLQYAVIPYEVGDERIPPDLLAYRERGLVLGHLRAQALGEASGPLRHAQYEHLPGLLLEDVMQQCVEHLVDLRVEDSDEAPLRQGDGIGDELVEIALDDLLWLGDDLGLQVEATLGDSGLMIAQKDVPYGPHVSLLPLERLIVLEYAGRWYRYGRGFLRQAYAGETPPFCDAIEPCVVKPYAQEADVEESRADLDETGPMRLGPDLTVRSTRIPDSSFSRLLKRIGVKL